MPCFPRLRFVICAGLACVTLPAARAHDAFEITSDARLRADRIEVKLTLAWTTAMRAIHGGKRPDPWIPPEEFAAVAERLEKQAAAFFRVWRGEAELLPREVVVALTGEYDLEVLLVFPSGEKGGLSFTAAVLAELPDEGYGSVLTVLGEEGAFLGQETLWRETPTFVLRAAAGR